jgi:hypothetical protein
MNNLKYIEMIRLKLILIIHLISAATVIYSLINNTWINNYIILNNFLNFEEKISENDIIRLWLIAIQCRYVITDIIAIKQNKMLIGLYSSYHFLEGIICLLVFYYKEKYVFSLICFVWSCLWTFGLKNNRKLKLYLN